MSFSRWFLVTSICSLLPWLWRYLRKAESLPHSEVSVIEQNSPALSLTSPPPVRGNIELATALLVAHVSHTTDEEVVTAFQRLTPLEQVQALVDAGHAMPPRSFSTVLPSATALQRLVLSLLPQHREALAPMLRLVDLCPELKAYYTQWGREDLLGYVKACQGRGMSKMRDLLPELVEEFIRPPNTIASAEALLADCLDEETRQQVQGAIAASQLDENTEVVAVLERLESGKRDGIGNGLTNGATGVFLNKLSEKFPEKLAYTILAKPDLFLIPFWPEFFITEFAHKHPEAAAEWVRRCRAQNPVFFLADTAEARLVCEAIGKSTPQAAANLWQSTSPTIQSIMCRRSLSSQESFLSAENHGAFFAALPDDAARDHLGACLAKNLRQLLPAIITSQWRHLEASVELEKFAELPPSVIGEVVQQAGPGFVKAYQDYALGQTPFVKAAKARNWATAMENLPSVLSSLEERFLQDSVGEMTRIYPEGLRQWVTSLPTGPQKQIILSNYVHHWAIADPMSAKAFVDSLSPGVEQSLGYFRLHVISAAQMEYTSAESYLRDCLNALKDHPASHEFRIGWVINDFIQSISKTNFERATTLRKDAQFRPFIQYMSTPARPKANPPAAYWKELLLE